VNHSHHQLRRTISLFRANSLKPTDRFVAFFAIVLLLLGNDFAAADVIIDLEPATYVAESGIQEMVIRARTNANDSVLGISVNFALPSGGQFAFVTQTEFENDNFDPVTMQTVTSGPNYTRYFNEVGYIGFGNIDKSGSFLQIDPAPDSTLGYLALEFNSLEALSNSFTPLGKLRINVNGLSVNSYAVNITDAFAVSSGNLPVSFSNGSFNIVAVPEPASLAFLGIALTASLGRRWHVARRRQKCC
jgi:hypothetical protein